MSPLKKILTLPLLALLMVASLGFSVNRHYCKGQLVAEQFFAMPHPCHMADSDHCGEGDALGNMGCCENENLLIEGIEILSNTTPRMINDGQQGHLNLVCSSKLLYFARLDLSPPLPYYPPEPPGGKKLLIKCQRFLI